MNFVNFIGQKSSGGLSESSQQNIILFTHVNKISDDTYQAISECFKCRDYLGDFVWAEKKKTSFQVFGMDVDSKQYKLDDDLSLYVEGNEKLHTFFPNILHDIEEKNGFQKTKILKVAHKKFSYILIADPLWKKSIWSVSLYSFLVKICFLSSDKENWIGEIAKGIHTESSYIKSFNSVNMLIFVNNIGNLLKEKTTLSGYSKENYNLIHNKSGFLNTFNKYSDENHYRMIFEKLKNETKAA